MFFIWVKYSSVKSFHGKASTKTTWVPTSLFNWTQSALLLSLEITPWLCSLLVLCCVIILYLCASVLWETFSWQAWFSRTMDGESHQSALISPRFRGPSHGDVPGGLLCRPTHHPSSNQHPGTWRHPKKTTQQRGCSPLLQSGTDCKRAPPWTSSNVLPQVAKLAVQACSTPSKAKGSGRYGDVQ